MERKQKRVPDEEIGATSGKTHDEVLDQTIGRERRIKNQAREGEPGEASR